MADVVFWLGPTAAGRFDPRTALSTGVGGSETAAIHLSRELARLGHRVTVYAEVGGMGNDEHGVVWVDSNLHKAWSDDLLPNTIDCDLFIASRHPGALRTVAPRCRRKWLWVHDLHCGPDWDNEIGVYDRVLCLTKWAREKFLSYYPGLDKDKVSVTSNAVDHSLFDDPVLRPGDQHIRRHMYGDNFELAPMRVTYSSSPDRGLDNLLDYWPEIVAMVAPKRAELDVYYGFDTWKRVAERHGSVVEFANVERLEARLAAMKNQGVFHHGRAGQAEVARSYLQSELWLYPTDFLETSCITAMEAQAAHCKIVATRCGALPETAPGAWFVEGPTRRPSYRGEFLAAVREILCDDSVVVRDPPSWEDVARQWDGWLLEELRS